MELLELVHALEKALGVRAQIRHMQEQPGDVPQTCADVGKAERLLGTGRKRGSRMGSPAQWIGI